MAKYKINKLYAKDISYSSVKRNHNTVKYIVIHYTGNKEDTAYGNAHYFSAKGDNKRCAGAHFFVDKRGKIYKSIPLNRAAWSVGGFYTKEQNAAKYYKKCINSNSVSIELCDIADSGPSAAQTAAVKWLIHNYIQKYCKNANKIIRHWDVNGKECPATMIGNDNSKWKNFRNKIK